MIEKKRLKRNYIDVQTNIDDFNNLSEGILNITKLPEVLTAGKNLFKFSPNFDIVDIGRPIYIEILDSGGEPVFHEVLEFQESDDSINIAVYVYETTKPGDCVLTILSTIFVDRDGNPLNPEEIFDQNYKYTHNLKINTRKKNESEIVYLHYPQVSIQEKRYSILEERFEPEKQITVSGSADYFLSDENVPILRARENLFKKDYENGIIWFPNLSNEISPKLTTSSFSYTSSIQRVLTPYQVYLDSRVYATTTQEVEDEILSSINQPYYITYNKIPLERNSTRNIKSFAVVDIYNLDPEAGHVSRVKVFGKSATKPNQSYELFYDGRVTEKNYLVTSSNYFVETPIGVFSDEIKIYDFDTKVTASINPYSYWKTTSIKGAPSATIASSSNYLLNPISIKPDSILSGNQDIILEQKPEYFAKFNDNTVYSLVFDYSVEENKYDNREPLLNVYATGSAFVNTTEYGAFVAEIPLTDTDNRFALDYSVKLPVNSAGTGIIRFLLRDGTSISNIRIVSETDFGFTPNISRLYVPIKTDHRNEFLDFKIEYFNDSLQQANISTEIYSVFFQGGNVYIYGDDSYITGSQQVGQDSVIKSEGYEGIDAAKKNVLENNPLYYLLRTTTREQHSAYVKNDNTLWTWGLGTLGRLGHGNNINRSSPTQVGTLKNWASASVGDDYTMAITVSGSLWGWGSNAFRKIGATGIGTSVSSPVQVGTQTDWNKVFSGTGHTLGIKRDGSLWAWGSNNQGQLGLGDIVNRSSPVQVGDDKNWKEVALGSQTTIALRNDGTLWSWGNNDVTSGRFTTEVPIVIDRSSPVQIGTLSNWRSVVGNEFHMMAINTLGELWTWGVGTNGRLGQVTDNLSKSSPVQVGTLKNWVSASAGKLHSLAIKNDGTLWAWGYNIAGALGQDDVVSRSSPVQVGSASNWLYTHGGDNFTFGIDRSGSFYGWGENTNGELGLNVTSSYSSSVKISTASIRPISKSLFGWSMHVGDPFNAGVVQNTVQFINEDGDYLEFNSYPAKLDMTFIGTSSRLQVIGESSSLLWDGDKIKITGAEITASSITGSISPDSLPSGLVSGSPQTLEHLYGTNIVSGAGQRNILGLAESDSPRFANLTLDGNLTARQYIVSSSVYIVTQSFSSGSTIFGNDSSDTHQFTGSVYITDSLFATASNAVSASNAQTASYFDGIDTLKTGSFTGSFTGSLLGTASNAETASYLIGLNVYTGSYTGSFTGSLIGTSSNAISASYAQTSSYLIGLNTYTGSYTGSFTGSFLGEGSGSFSGSHWGYHFGTASLSGSFTGSLFGTASNAVSSSYSLTSSYAVSASYSLSSSYSVSASYAVSSSYSVSSSYALSSSYTVTASYAVSSSHTTGFSGSFIGYLTGSFDGNFSGSLIVGHYTGSLTGSVTGSLLGEGSGSFSGSHWGYHFGTASLSGSFTGSLIGNASGSFTGSYFGTSSNLSGSFTGSILGQGSGSFSGSHFGSASLSGSFDGIFRGQGSGSFSGSHWGYHFGTASLSGSFTGSYLGTGIGAYRGIGSASYIGVTNPGTASFWGLASSSSLIQVYESNGKWRIPSWAQKVTIICIGGGGAGGPGSTSTSTTVLRGGGGGGNGGTLVWSTFAASSFNGNIDYDISVGAGGSGTGANEAQRMGGTSQFGGSEVASPSGLQFSGQYPTLKALGGLGGESGKTSTTSHFFESTQVVTYPRYRYYPDMQGPRTHPGGPGGSGGVGKTWLQNTVEGGAGFLSGYESYDGNLQGFNSTFGSANLDASDLPFPYRNHRTGLPSVTVSQYSAHILYFSSLFFFRHSAEIAPTGGGGGAGISGSNNTFTGGRGGAIKTYPQQEQYGYDNNVPPVIMERENYRYNTTAPSIPFLYTQVGLGGRGASTNGTGEATPGAKYGGGGGGGRATSGQTGQHYGANGGQGVVVVISEA